MGRSLAGPLAFLVSLAVGLPVTLAQPSLADGPYVFSTFEQPRIRVEVVTRGLSHPWALAFLPDGDMLVTDRNGLHRIRDDVLVPEPVAGLSEVLADAEPFGPANAILMDIAVHPDFATNRYVYLTHMKKFGDGQTVALARGRFDGESLHDVHDIFVAEPGFGEEFSYPGRIVFAGDGTLFMTIGGAAREERVNAQDMSTHAGKVLRLRDDGSAPGDNPFAGQAGFLPEIYTLGHRMIEGAAIHPQTGALWVSEHGPQGGDEVNIIVAGANYGWPLVSFGREYAGPFVSAQTSTPGTQRPVVVWVPSIAPSGMTFYTGERFPAWRGNLFVGAMMEGRIAGTGHLERIVMNDAGEELRRESLLAELRQRIRDVRQGPDGAIYLLTEEDAAAILRITPAD